MITMQDHKLIKKIAQRAADLYDRIGVRVHWHFIASELTIVHDEIVRLRLAELLEARDGDFAHDIGGIHRHLRIEREPQLDCFLPRFAVV